MRLTGQENQMPFGIRELSWVMIAALPLTGFGSAYHYVNRQ
jgi:hypothetical protein